MTDGQNDQTHLEETIDVSRDSPLNGAGTAPDPAWFEQAVDEPPFARHVLTTPLHLDVAAESRTNRWTDWSGYTVADVYTSVDQEYDALRTRAGLADISPLVKYRLSGREVVPYLDRLLTRSAGTLAIDEAARSVLCAGDGNIITEGMLFRLAEEEFRLVVRSSHLDWLEQSALGFDVQVDDVTGTIAGLSLAGPSSTKVLAAAGMEKPEALKKNQAAWVQLGGMPVYVSRTGMMGGVEYELWSDPSDASVLWRRLLEVGCTQGVKPVGAAARNIARIENGIALEATDYQSAFTAADGRDARSPYDLSLGGLVELERAVFNGQKALSAVVEAGSSSVVVGLEIDLSEGAIVGSVCIGDSRVGQVTSHAWSPSLHCILALAVIDASALGASDGFAVETGAGERRSAKLTKRPFFRLP